MKTTDLLITPRDPLILRDGRPFGQSGVPQAGTFFWPRPGTVIGMARTCVGTLRSPDYFQGEDAADHIANIKKVSMQWFLPAVKGDKQYTVCLPAPADAIAFPVDTEKPETGLDISAIHPLSPAPDEGTDLTWSGWLYPWLEDKRKREKKIPLFWHWSRMKTWLRRGAIDSNITAEELGIFRPVSEERTHVCIDPETGSAAESRLFTTMGVRFDAGIHIAAKIGGLDDADNLPSRDVATLGGDRRPIFVSWNEQLVDWPALPAGIGTTEGFRLILTSPGLFSGGWVPEWLKASLDGNDFVTVPGADVRLRLCSACIPRWQPGHGWDMTIGKKGAPKPLRKMVPAGAVYFVTAAPGTDMQAAAQALWNRSLCEDEQDRRDGFGRILVGNWNTQPQSSR